VRDSLTAVAWFHRRTPEQFFDVAYQLYVLPEHLLKNVPRDKLGTSDAAKNPVGSGPFRLVRYEPGVRLELIADTAHYLGRPKLDRVIWAFASDASAAVAQLMSGQADMYETLPPDVIPRVDSSSSVRLVRYPGLQYGFMSFNQKAANSASTPHPIFSDRAVRRALSMAVDRQGMLRNVFDTLGVLGTGPFPRTLADTTVVLPPFDRARAMALLDSAGWRMGPDSVRVKNGRRLQFGLIVPTSSRPRMRYAVLIQEQFRSIGAKVDIESMDINAFLQRQGQGKFDASMQSVGTDPGLGAIKQFWLTEGIGGGGQNFVKYSNKTADALVDSALHTFDQTRALQYYHRAVQSIVDDAPAIWLYDVLTVAGLHRRIEPAAMRADGWWAGLPKFSIPESKRIDRDKIGLRAAQGSSSPNP